jgi:hypothetical protein
MPETAVEVPDVTILKRTELLDKVEFHRGRAPEFITKPAKPKLLKTGSGDCKSAL